MTTLGRSWKKSSTKEAPEPAEDATKDAPEDTEDALDTAADAASETAATDAPAAADADAASEAVSHEESDDALVPAQAAATESVAGESVPGEAVRGEAVQGEAVRDEAVRDEAEDADGPLPEDSTEAETKLIHAKAELAKAEAELARARLAEAEAELARAEKAARSRQKARDKALLREKASAKEVRVSTVELGPAPDAAEAAQEPSRSPLARNKALLLVGALGAVVVALGAILAWLWTDSDSLDAKEQGGKSALIAATAAAQDISSYDYRSLDTDIKTVQGETTGQFRQQYDQEMALVKATATQKQIVTVGTILKAGVESVGAKQVVVVVFLNQQTSSGGQTSATPDQYRLQLTMTKKGGRWLVSTLKAL